MNRKRIVVMGFMGGCPIAGVIWQHIHYIVGLQRLGHEVYYIEDSARLPFGPLSYEPAEGFANAARTLAALADEFGFAGRWAYGGRFLAEPEFAGLSRAQIGELYRTADAVLNVCGAQEMNDDLLQSERLIYVESDPGHEQMRIDNGDPEPATYLSRHRALFTFGENVGSAEFPVPLHEFRWLPTRQPVVTDFWKTSDPPPTAAVFTSVANWNTSGLKDVEWRGERYLWSKSLEFLKFIEAPQRAGESFELASDIRDAAVAARLRETGWRLREAATLSTDHHRYREYVQHSKGEFTVAKDQYVRLNTGWFSDRSACYLAAGRPVITQETGFSRRYGGERGLCAFQTLEEIAEAVARINSEPATHQRAASEVASEYFEATKVLASLLERAGV